MSNKQNKIVLKSARKRGQLYAEAQVAIIEEKVLYNYLFTLSTIEQALF